MTRWTTGHADSEEEWIESYGVPAEVRDTDRRLQAVIDALPNSIPADALRACEGCGARYAFELRGSGHLPDASFDMDGSACVGLVCPDCGRQSCHFWCWDVEQIGETS